MTALDFDIRLQSIERFLKRKHGGQRLLTAGEQIILIAGAQEILAQLKAGWPIRTGRSIAGWDVAPVTRDFIGYKVSNRVDYAEFVHRRGEGPDPLWTRQMLIIRDGILPRIVSRLKAAIAETERYSSEPIQAQPTLFLQRPQQATLGNPLSQARRLRRLVRRRR